jgi:hypothetical protein
LCDEDLANQIAGEQRGGRIERNRIELRQGARECLLDRVAKSSNWSRSSRHHRATSGDASSDSLSGFAMVAMLNS